MTMYTGLARIARRTGYPVEEVPGWETRTRPQAMQDVRTITCHHTAGPTAAADSRDYPSYNTVLNGRRDPDPAKDIPGALANYGIGRSGKIYVFAAGSANHAGVSRSVDYEKIHAIGIEAEAHGIPGTKGDWPEAQMDAYAKLCKALIEEFGLSVNDVRGHKETCSPPGRKSDPDFNMDQFRSRVAAVKLGTGGTTQGDDDMPTADEIAKAVWGYDRELTEADAKAYGGDTKEGDVKGMNEFLRFPPAVARLRRETAAQIGALSAAVAALAGGGTLTEAQVQAASQAGAKAALTELGHDLID